MTETLCPCGSEKPFADCCQPILTRAVVAPTPEAVMRARYSAFVTADIDYLYDSLKPGTRDDFNRAHMEQWAKTSTWKGLEVRSRRGGEEGETEGWVEFLAHFEIDGKDYVHHETGHFVKQDGAWYYQDGANGQGTVRNAVKVGRNDPCPCGSGKKYKKCCGA